MNDVARTVEKTTSRLATMERQIANGTWRPTPEAVQVIFRHTLGILAALQGSLSTAEMGLGSS